MRLTYARAVSVTRPRRKNRLLARRRHNGQPLLPVRRQPLPTVVACAPASGTGRSLSRELVAA